MASDLYSTFHDIQALHNEISHSHSHVNHQMIIADKLLLECHFSNLDLFLQSSKGFHELKINSNVDISSPQ